nr:PepSY-associated TM helix domain-containing protein [uncultured Prevotella sp.]
MRKFCLKIHRWFALPLGVIMAILCFSGLAILLIKDLAPLFDMNAKELPIYTTIVRLHRWLFMKPENAHEGGQSLGRILTAVTSMCMAVVLLSGVVIWWPKTKKALKSRLKVSTNKGFRRFVYDSHVSLGIYVFIFLFLMALTGPVFSFGWYRAGMSKLFGQPIPPKEMKMQQAKEGSQQGATNDKAFAHTDTSQTKGQPQAQKDGAKDLKGDHHGKKPKGGKLFKQLHTGSWGGWFSRVLYAIAAFIGGFLPISGYYLWWKRRSAKKKKA